MTFLGVVRLRPIPILACAGSARRSNGLLGSRSSWPVRASALRLLRGTAREGAHPHSALFLGPATRRAQEKRETWRKGVHHVLEGSVQRAGDRGRVTATGQASTLVRPVLYLTRGHILVESTRLWTCLSSASHSVRTSTLFRLIGPQCLRTLRNPTAVNSAANAGDAFESRWNSL